MPVGHRPALENSPSSRIIIWEAHILAEVPGEHQATKETGPQWMNPHQSGRFRPVIPASGAISAWAPGTCWLHPLLPRHTWVRGGGWEAGIKEGAGSWHGAQRTPPRGRAWAELARHLTTCSFLQSARDRDRAGGAGHEGLTVNGKWQVLVTGAEAVPGAAQGPDRWGPRSLVRQRRNSALSSQNCLFLLTLV